MDFNVYLDQLNNFVRKHQIFFTNDAESEDYLETCDFREHWRYGLEWNKLLKVFRLKPRQAVRDKEAELENFLVFEEETLNIRLNLMDKNDYRRFAQFLKNRNPTGFETLVSYLKSNPELVGYMKTIIQAPHGYFPYKGASQNVALWLCGQSKAGKTSLAAVITSFLVACKMRATNEKFMNTHGDGNVSNKPFCYNIFQLEELKKGGKGPDDVMDLIDAGVSLIKGLESTGWGADKTHYPYHFPVIITSNYTPEQFFIRCKYNENDRLFCEAALGRIVCLQFTQSCLPDLSHKNKFDVPPILLAKFLWAFVFHSDIQIDMAEAPCYRNYHEPESIELTPSDLCLPKGSKVALLQPPQEPRSLLAESRLTTLLLSDKVNDRKTLMQHQWMNDDKVSVVSQQLSVMSSRSTQSVLSQSAANQALIGNLKLFFAFLAEQIQNPANNLSNTLSPTFLHCEFISWLKRSSVTTKNLLPVNLSTTLFGRALRQFYPDCGLRKGRENGLKTYEIDIEYWLKSNSPSLY